MTDSRTETLQPSPQSSQDAAQLCARIIPELTDAYSLELGEQTAYHDASQRPNRSLGGMSTCSALLVALTEPDDLSR